MKIGDLVKYSCPLTDKTLFGHIVDSVEDYGGFYMYEVVCTNPFDKGWFSDLQLEVVSER